MANLNRVALIGRLTRDPEIREFSNGGKVANIGFAVNNPRKNPETGEWEEAPVWVELKAFNRDNGRKLADLAEQHLRKGKQIYVDGHLVLEEWTGKEDGKKQSRMVVHVDRIEFLERREEGTRGREEAPRRQDQGAAAKKELEEIPF